MARQLSVRIPEELDEEIRRIARELRLKRSEVVRLALQRMVDEFGKEEGKRPFERVKHLVGSVRSGVPDLGTEHRKHIFRKFGKNA